MDLLSILPFLGLMAAVAVIFLLFGWVMRGQISEGRSLAYLDDNIYLLVYCHGEDNFWVFKELAASPMPKFFWRKNEPPAYVWQPEKEQQIQLQAFEPGRKAIALLKKNEVLALYVLPENDEDGYYSLPETLIIADNCDTETIAANKGKMLKAAASLNRFQPTQSLQY